jgi:uncharacterized protein involved in exopolysaccharide biosynthesis
LSHQEKGPLQLLYERLYVVAITTAVAVAAAWFVAGRLDPIYRAQARCFMPTNPDMLSLSSEAENLPRAPKLPTGSTEIQDSLLGVLRAADLRQSVAVEIEGRDSAYLEKNVDFELDRYNLLTITVYDADPAVAQRIAEVYLRQFRDKLDQSTKSDIRQKADLFDERARSTRAEIERLEKERLAFLAGLGTVDFGAEFQMTADRVKAYRQRVDDLDARAVALQTGLSELRRQLGERPDPADPEAFVQRSLAEVSNPRIEQIQGQIITAELQLGQLRQAYEAGHPQVIAKQAEIDTLRGQLATEVERIAGSYDFGPDPLAEDLQRRHYDQLVQIAVTSSEREVYGRLLEQAQADFARLPEYDLVLSDYDAQLAQLRTTLTDARRRLAESQLYLGRTTSFLETAEAPALPTEPWFPNVPLILLAAAMLGVVLSTTAAVAMSRTALFRQEALW